MRHRTGPANRTLALDDASPANWRKADRTRFVLVVALLAAFLAAPIFVPVGYFALAAQAQSVGCSKYAAPAPRGSDANPGTYSAPYKSAQKLLDSLSVGQTGCLRAGIYTEADGEARFNRGGTSDGNRVALQSAPGETAEFRGSIFVPDGVNYVTVSNMRLDGSYAAVDTTPGKDGPRTKTAQSVRLKGDHVNILGNDITNRSPDGDPDRAGTCIILNSKRDAADHTVVAGNRIHGCGQLPRSNHEHGIYALKATSAVIRDNLFYDNADRGVQLFPNAHGTLVEGNVFDGNGTNFAINYYSSNNTVRNNVFSNPAVGPNVNLGPRLSGTSNSVIDNCFWTPGGESAFKDGGKNTTVSANIIANPGYQNRDGFKITNPACLAKYSGTRAR